MHQKGQHLPDTPPYVVLSPAPTAGQGVLSAFSPISPDTVLVAVTPSAPPVKQKVSHFLLNHEYKNNRGKKYNRKTVKL